MTRMRKELPNSIQPIPCKLSLAEVLSLCEANSLSRQRFFSQDLVTDIISHLKNLSQSRDWLSNYLTCVLNETESLLGKAEILRAELAAAKETIAKLENDLNNKASAKSDEQILQVHWIQCNDNSFSYLLAFKGFATYVQIQGRDSYLRGNGISYPSLGDLIKSCLKDSWYDDVFYYLIYWTGDRAALAPRVKDIINA